MTKEQLGSLILDSERQLYSTAKTILFSDHDCADAIQETIVKAFSNVGTLKNDNYARTWLIRILINECYSLVRKSSKFIPLENLAADQRLWCFLFLAISLSAMRHIPLSCNYRCSSH